MVWSKLLKTTVKPTGLIWLQYLHLRSMVYLLCCLLTLKTMECNEWHKYSFYTCLVFYTFDGDNLYLTESNKLFCLNILAIIFRIYALPLDIPSRSISSPSISSLCTKVDILPIIPLYITSRISAHLKIKPMPNFRLHPLDCSPNYY